MPRQDVCAYLLAALIRPGLCLMRTVSYVKEYQLLAVEKHAKFIERILDV
jgi:hypothetical protein